jgi:hypothetical protein
VELSQPLRSRYVYALVSYRHSKFHIVDVSSFPVKALCGQRLGLVAPPVQYYMLGHTCGNCIRKAEKARSL